MISKPKLTFAALILATTIASPALAQSFDHTGSQLPYYYDGTGKQTWGTWGPSQASAEGRQSEIQRRGLNAYAMTPDTGWPQSAGWGYDPTIARER